MREERIAKSTWCSSDRAGSAPYTSEVDRFSFWSVQVQPSDGKVANAKSNKAAEGQACFGLPPMLPTSNTIASKVLLGGETNPPGYLQASIATIRLWRAQ
jgi:hypothetical protein